MSTIGLSILLGIFLIAPFAYASSTDGVIDSIGKHAWSENAGWVDFGTDAGNVHITDSALTGYAWGENIGWISLNCSNTDTCSVVDYKVTNNAEGTLSGHAWGENVGWIQFAPIIGGVTIDASGIFSGYAWGDRIGWIVFNCSNQSSCGIVDYKVSTDWRPESVRGSFPQQTGTTVERGGGRRGGPGRGGVAVPLEVQTEINNPSSMAAPSGHPPKLNPSFRDIPSGAWFAAFIYTLADLGVVSGYEDKAGNLTGEFGPADLITVGQAIKITLLAAGHELSVPVGVPQNATATDWSAPYVALAESLNILLAAEDVQRPATRGEVIQALFEAFEIDIDVNDSPFTDLPASHVHANVIATAHALGIVTGDTDAEGNPLNTVRPDDTINRAEVAALVVRMLERE